MRVSFSAKNWGLWRVRGLQLRQVAALALVLLLTVPGGAAEDRAVKSRVAPVYPELAKRMKIAGVVKIEATVNADGKVTDVKTLNGNRALSSAAEEAVRKWKFASGDGEAKVDVDVSFVLAP
jgi:TonB family protein